MQCRFLPLLEGQDFKQSSYRLQMPIAIVIQERATMAYVIIDV